MQIRREGKQEAKRHEKEEGSEEKGNQEEDRC
jgi:hypothetical protein